MSLRLNETLNEIETNMVEDSLHLNTLKNKDDQDMQLHEFL